MGRADTGEIALGGFHVRSVGAHVAPESGDLTTKTSHYLHLFAYKHTASPVSIPPSLLPLFWVSCAAAVWSYCFALPSPSPWRHIKRPEAEANSGPLWFHFHTPSLSPVSLFLSFPPLRVVLLKSGTVPICPPSPSAELCPSDCQERKRKHKGEIICAWLSVSPSPLSFL